MPTMPTPRGATPETDLPDWRKDPRFADLARRRDDLHRKRRGLELDIPRLADSIASAEAELEPLEVDLMTGAGDARALDRARASLAKARGDLADRRAEAASLDGEIRKVAAALEIVADAAKTAAAGAFPPAYREALARLDAALAAASEASERVFAIWDRAEVRFPVTERSARGVLHRECAGLVRADWPDLAMPGAPSRNGEQGDTRYSAWRAEVEAGAIAGAEPPSRAPRPGDFGAGPDGLFHVDDRGAVVWDHRAGDGTGPRRLRLEGDAPAPSRRLARPEPAGGWAGEA